MDKYEYRIRSEEIKTLIAEKDYVQAAEIADMIDWRRVKSVMMLCTISDLYKINRRYEEARDILLLAYDRHPGGRNIVYSLCELSLKLEEFVQAVEYYKEFAQIAPKDSGRYILQYKLYEAQDVSLEERIAVLEELKKRDFREKWGYKLAYLYHRVGLVTRCVEECDELILWFGEGKYVLKAMELKMLHQPLDERQQAQYDRMVYGRSVDRTEIPVQEMDVPASASEEMDIQVRTMEVGQYDTINLQKELAEGLKEVLGSQEVQDAHDAITQSIIAPLLEEEQGDMNQEAANQEMVALESQAAENDSVYEEESKEEAEPEEMSEVFFGETGEIGDMTEIKQEMETPRIVREETEGGMAHEGGVSGDTRIWEEGDIRQIQATVGEAAQVAAQMSAAQEAEAAELPWELARRLAMEADGQISLVVPESEQIEKQITGQISLEDIMTEWERMKQDNKEKQEEAVRQRVMEHTGALFSDFDASRDADLLGLLEFTPGEREENLSTDEMTDTEEASDEEAVIAVEDISDTEEMADAHSLSETNDSDSREDSDPESEDVESEDVESEDMESDDWEEEQQLERVVASPDAEGAVEEEAEEAAEDEEGEWESMDESPKPERKIRKLTREEKELFGQFIQNRSSREQLVTALDGITLAAYTGNVILTGDEGMDTMSMARNVVRQVQISDSNFSGKVAKISGKVLNSKKIAAVMDKVRGGALIIHEAGSMGDGTLNELYQALQRETLGIVVLLVDSKRRINRILERKPEMTGCFNARIDMQALDNEALVQFGRKYAREMEYSIDDLGILALHTRIEDLQTSDHAVTIMEVRDIVDEAIRHSNRKTPRHFMDVLMSKRYDDNDMVVLRERDFI